MPHRFPIFLFALGICANVLPLAARPHILWINCEDLDPALGCYGDPIAKTPHLDRLAAEGILYRQAFANAPICAPARSCLITGMYPTSLGSQHLRCEITLPEAIEPFPTTLKRAGYWVSNYAKTDYNFDPAGIYDYWKKDLAPWRQRSQDDQPFFSFIVLGTTHEGPGNFRQRYEAAVERVPKEARVDPDTVAVPPYFPDTPAMRELWARYYDLTTALDLQVGEIMANLKEDGLLDDTIVFFFSDHGHGMPRHKRWLLDSGLRVPLIVRVPPGMKALAEGLAPGAETDRLVSFVDFAPTVLHLAGIDVPDVLQGRPFLGSQPAPPRRFIYGARDRADDMFEVSRAVHDGRFLYVRHFLPHLPYLQGGRIFGNQKESLAELRRARDAGEMNAVSARLFAEHKPIEEFYDLQTDPHEVRNLAADADHAQKMTAMREVMKDWILEHRDCGFLTESEYTRRARAEKLSVYEMAQREDLYDLPAVLASAWGEAIPESSDTGVLYWQIVRRDPKVITREALAKHSHHVNPSIAVAAAEVACQRGHVDIGLSVLERYVASADLRLALEAARACYEVGTAAKPLAARLEAVRLGLEGSGGQRRYRDFNYASFTGWALEAALVRCGEATWPDFD